MVETAERETRERKQGVLVIKITILGANGQLGLDLVRVFKNTEPEIIPLTHKDMDVTDFKAARQVLKDIQPEIVLNCAAYVRVDDAEEFAEKAFAVNALGARNIALTCNELDSVMVHVSTDYIFDGLKKKPYTEEDIPNPLNVYGNSKLAGEYFVRNTIDRHYIIRSSSLFGTAGASGKGGNFVETMIKKARNNEEINVVDDIIMSPTYTKDAADMIASIITKKLPFGIYHVANNGQCSWFDFARTIFEMLSIGSKLSPTKTNILQSRAKRPMFSPLASFKLKNFGLEMERWEAALNKYLIEKGSLKM
jgi:dTDP-4-dehydrorhamnose reductase